MDFAFGKQMGVGDGCGDHHIRCYVGVTICGKVATFITLTKELIPLH